MPRLPRRLQFLFLLWLTSLSAQAQWTSQIIPLRPGWNAVYLEVQPEPRECDAIFAGSQVESVWRYNRKQATVQFIEDPNQLVPNAPNWLTWLPPNHPIASRSQLFILEGGRPYLVKLADNATPVNWTVRGPPVIRKPDWLADSGNFVGFPLPTNNPPTLQSFFTNSAALATNRIFRLNTNGAWTQVLNPATNRMQRGEAFWILSTGLPDYAGPLEVQLDRRTGLDFGRVLTEQTLRIRNPATNTSRTVVLRQLPSELPVSIAYPAVAGSVPLSYWQNDFAGNRLGWTNLPAQLTQSNLPPGATWEVRLEVRRPDMTPYSQPPGVSNAYYQSLLEIADTSNTTRLLIPVKSDGLQSYNATASAADGRVKAAGETPTHPRAGLWIGTVSINKVSQPSGANPSLPVPVSGEFQFRILVHVDATGQARLLQKVLQMWKAGQTNAAGGVATPGQFVLLTDESLISAQYTGAAERDGKLVGRRFSSATFGFRDPILMSGAGDFGASNSLFTCVVSLSHTNALNPFVHRYHPDHDNLDDRQQPLTVKTNATGQIYTAESTGVDRVIQLQFTAGDPENLALSGWGDTQLGGNYTETLSGLHRMALISQGVFRITLAARVANLNQ